MEFFMDFLIEPKVGGQKMRKPSNGGDSTILPPAN